MVFLKQKTQNGQTITQADRHANMHKTNYGQSTDKLCTVLHIFAQFLCNKTVSTCNVHNNNIENKSAI